MRLTLLDVVLLFYAALTLIGGVVGYLDKHSTMSLVSAVSADVLITLGIIVSKRNESLGYGLCAFVAFALLAFFTFRFIRSAHVWPAIPMIVASAAALAFLIQKHFAQRGG